MNFTKIGYGAIVIANDLNISNLTKLELKKILSTKIQNRGDMIENPYQFLNQINSKFPKIPIKIYSNLDKNQKEILQNFIGELKNTKKPNFADKNGIFLLSFADFYNKNNGLKLAFINDINPNKKNIKSLFYPLSYPLFLGENNETNSTKNHLEIAEILGIIR